MASSMGEMAAFSAAQNGRHLARNECSVHVNAFVSLAFDFAGRFWHDDFDAVYPIISYACDKGAIGSFEKQRRKMRKIELHRVQFQMLLRFQGVQYIPRLPSSTKKHPIEKRVYTPGTPAICNPLWESFRSGDVRRPRIDDPKNGDADDIKHFPCSINALGLLSLDSSSTIDSKKLSVGMDQ